jgi:hypothetical protein
VNTVSIHSSGLAYAHRLYCSLSSMIFALSVNLVLHEGFILHFLCVRPAAMPSHAFKAARPPQARSGLSQGHHRGAPRAYLRTRFRNSSKMSSEILLLLFLLLFLFLFLMHSVLWACWSWCSCWA